MEEKCKNCEGKESCIPFFAHEDTMMHYNHANRRMLIALVKHFARSSHTCVWWRP